MDHFEYRGEEMWCEGVPLGRIAEEVGTPCYVYSKAGLVQRIKQMSGAWSGARQPVAIAYAMRANPGRALLGILNAEESWVAVTSAAEMMQALKAGFSPGRMVWTGMASSEDELRLALDKGLFLVVADSRSQLDSIHRTATELKTRARTSIRIHATSRTSSSKVGITQAQAEEVFRHAADTEGLEVIGVHHFMGQHVTEAQPLLESLAETLDLVDRLAEAGVMLTVLDLGGSAGSLYDDPQFAAAIQDAVGDRMLKVVLEPGRSLVGRTGILLTRVRQLKETMDRRYLVVDASMNELASPALFQAAHEVKPVRWFEPPDAPLYDVVGPMFESTDHIALRRSLAGVVPGDVLAVMNTGAFGWVLSGNYGMRPRPAEVVVFGEEFRVVRRAEVFQDLVRTEMDVLP